MMADLRHLLAIYVHAHQTGNSVPPHIDAEARAALADEPAVPQGREPASVTGQPSDEDPAPTPAEEVMGPTYDDLSKLCSKHGLDVDDWPLERFDALWEVSRAILARWGNPAPAPPADGEVAELVGELRNFVAAYKSCHNNDHIWGLSGGGINARLTVTLISRAVELLQWQVLVPVSVSERLPEPNTKVLAHYVNDLGKGRTICAIWVPAKSRSDEGGHDDFTEYDEEDDKFYWPEGWYEAIENWDELGYVRVYEGEVDYWQPLPMWPAHALPLPEVGE